ncbi:hypothetical protein R6G99_06400, partial [Actinotignum timonense]|nr:hypothetical protein [Actinotignum timonense]
MDSRTLASCSATRSGAAQLLAAGIDRARLDGVLGCVAGD